MSHSEGQHKKEQETPVHEAAKEHHHLPQTSKGHRQHDNAEVRRYNHQNNMRMLFKLLVSLVLVGASVGFSMFVVLKKRAKGEKKQTTVKKAQKSTGTSAVAGTWVLTIDIQGGKTVENVTVVHPDGASGTFTEGQSLTVVFEDGTPPHVSLDVKKFEDKKGQFKIWVSGCIAAWVLTACVILAFLNRRLGGAPKKCAMGVGECIGGSCKCIMEVGSL